MVLSRAPSGGESSWSILQGCMGKASEQFVAQIEGLAPEPKYWPAVTNTGLVPYGGKGEWTKKKPKVPWAIKDTQPQPWPGHQPGGGKFPPGRAQEDCWGFAKGTCKGKKCPNGRKHGWAKPKGKPQGKPWAEKPGNPALTQQAADPNSARSKKKAAGKKGQGKDHQ